jgi:hypothetical protein
MRRLAASISAGATSMYFYVANKDELLELAVDEILAEVEVPGAGPDGWRDAAAGLARGVRAAVLRHSWVLSLLGTHPAIGPNAMRMSDRTIAVLTSAGFTGLEIGWAASMLMSHAIGFATSESAMNRATGDAARTPNELLEQISPFVESVAADYPNYAAWWRQNRTLDFDPGASFEFGLDRLLDGLQAWLDKKA